MKLSGMIIGGPGEAKEIFYEKNYLRPELKKKVIGLVPTGYVLDGGLYELTWRAQSLLRDTKLSRERELMEEFLTHISRQDMLAVYGHEEVKRLVESDLAKTVLISEEKASEYEDIISLCDRKGINYEIFLRGSDADTQLLNSFGGCGAIRKK
jgi:peptide subunit release factor 1 (eRF1)